MPNVPPRVPDRPAVPGGEALALSERGRAVVRRRRKGPGASPSPPGKILQQRKVKEEGGLPPSGPVRKSGEGSFFFEDCTDFSERRCFVVAGRSQDTHPKCFPSPRVVVDKKSVLAVCLYARARVNNQLEKEG